GGAFRVVAWRLSVPWKKLAGERAAGAGVMRITLRVRTIALPPGAARHRIAVNRFRLGANSLPGLCERAFGQVQIDPKLVRHDSPAGSKQPPSCCELGSGLLRDDLRVDDKEPLGWCEMVCG